MSETPEVAAPAAPVAAPPEVAAVEAALSSDPFEQEAIELFRGLLRIDTTNPPGNERAACELLQASLARDGIESELLEKAPGRTNLVARVKGSGAKSPLLLTGHTDVVAAEAERWKHPPFAGEVHDGWLWGRGAVDMKNMVAMSAMVLKALVRKGVKLDRDVVFAAVADEEEGCDFGSTFLCEAHPEKVRAEYALGEIGGFTLRMGGARMYPYQVAEKGMVWLDVKVKGTPGHGSMPRSDQAVTKLALALARIGQQPLAVDVSPSVRAMIEGIRAVQPLPAKLALGLMLQPAFTDFVLERLLPDPSIARTFNALLRNTVSATVVRAGYKTNVIPGEASAQVDGRFVPHRTSKDLIAELQALVGDEVELSVIRELPAVEVAPKGELVDAIARAVKAEDPEGHVLPYVMPGFTDAAPFSRLGIKFYGFAPVFFPETPKVAFAELYHSHDERIPVAGFFQGLRCLERVVTDFCAAK